MIQMLAEPVPRRQPEGATSLGNLDEFLLVDSMALRVGCCLQTPLYDERGVLLLSANTFITPSFLTNLKSRCISTVRLHKSELHHLRDPRRDDAGSIAANTSVDCQPMTPGERRGIDGSKQRPQLLGLPSQGPPFSAEVHARGLETYDEANVARVVQNHNEALHQMAALQKMLSNGQGVRAHSLMDIVDDAFADLSQDLDFFACLGINPQSDTYPARHSLHTSMLALAIATRLGLDRSTMKHLAMGCLIHDAGMMNLDKSLYERPEVLSSVDFIEITKHPIIVFELIKDAHQIPAQARAVAYQIHERCNGTGYPRRRRDGQIHVLAKIAGIADAFVALVSPRPHRPGFAPYQAIEQILLGTRAGLFDPVAVRALLHTTSLFPIGSLVELSDGRVGRVLRSNGSAYDRPIVEAWHPLQGESTSGILDLLSVPHIDIRRTLTTLDTPRPTQLELIDNWD